MSFLASRKKQLAAAAVLICGTIISVLGIWQAKFSNDISRLFPDGSDSAKALQLVNRAHLADSFQLEFIAEVPGTIGDHRDYLLAAAGRLRANSEIRNLHFELDPAAMAALPEAMPQLIKSIYPAEKLSRCLVPDAVRQAQQQLAMPVPDAVQRLRNTPLGLEKEFYGRLQQLNRASGVEASHDAGFVADRTRTRALMTFDAAIPLGESAKTVKLLADVEKTLVPLPANLSYRVHSGALHSLGNEAVLKTDSTAAGALAVLFFVLTLAIYGRNLREFRALWILVIPLASSFFALGATGWVCDEIYLFVAGLGSCVAGLVVDQGIHVFIACRREDPDARLRALVKPMLLSTLSSCAVFILLAFSGIAAYIQLALFASLSLIFSTAIALLILPLLIGKVTVPARGGNVTVPARWQKTAALLAVPLIVAAGAWSMPELRTDLSLASLDGTPENIRQHEAEFQRVWMPQRQSPALLAVAAGTPEAALQKLEKRCEMLAANGFHPELPPLPSADEQLKNRRSYHTAAGRKILDDLEKQTRRECRKAGLPEKFYAPLFAAWRSDPDALPAAPEILQSIQNKMVKRHSGSAVALALLPDDPATVEKVSELISGHEDTALLSGNTFKYLVKKDLAKRFLTLLPWSFAVAVLLALGVRDKLAVLAILPVIVAVAVLAGVFAAFDIAVTPAVLFALLLLTGLAVDYGIYAVHQIRSQDASLSEAMFLSAATTVLGTGTLIFSRHPALSGTGIVLAVGIAAAGFTGVWLMPTLAKCKTAKLLSLWAIMLTVAALAGCASLPEAKPLSLPAASLHANAVLSDGKNSMTVLVAAKFDPVEQQTFLVVLNSAGMRLFSAASGSGCDFELICPPLCRNAGRFLADELHAQLLSGKWRTGNTLTWQARHWWYGSRRIELKNMVCNMESVK